MVVDVGVAVRVEDARRLAAAVSGQRRRKAARVARELDARVSKSFTAAIARVAPEEARDAAAAVAREQREEQVMASPGSGGRQAITAAPASRRICAASRTARRSAGDAGRLPSSSNQATRSRARSTPAGSPSGAAGVLVDGVAAAVHDLQRQRDVGHAARHGPTWWGWPLPERDAAVTHVGQRPVVGLMLAMPQKCAGTRTEPPMSVPHAEARPASGHDRRLAPDEPPGVRARSHGLLVRRTPVCRSR